MNTYTLSALVDHDDWIRRDFAAFDKTYVLNAPSSMNLPHARSVVDALHQSMEAFPDVNIFVQCDAFTVVNRKAFDATAVLNKRAAVSVGGCSVFVRSYAAGLHEEMDLRQRVDRDQAFSGLFVYDTRANFTQLHHFAQYGTDGDLKTSHSLYHPIHSPSLYNFMVDVLSKRTPYHEKYHRLVACTHSPSLHNLLTSCCEATWHLRLPNRQPRCLQDRCSNVKTECPSAPSELLRDEIGILATIAPEASVRPLIRRLTGLFGLSEMRVQSYHGNKIVRGEGIDNLKPGEVGYRLSFYAAITYAMGRGSSFFWFDDDLLLHKRVDKAWADIQRSRECTGFLNEPGGILLLGASEWSSRKVWRHIPSERRCYNAFSRTFGSFAMFVSHQVLPWIERWLTLTNRPLDHMYTFLQQKGFVVRTAYPNLMIMNTSHVSSIDATRRIAKDRPNRMHWKLVDYV